MASRPVCSLLRRAVTLSHGRGRLLRGLPPSASRTPCGRRRPICHRSARGRLRPSPSCAERRSGGATPHVLAGAGSCALALRAPKLRPAGAARDGGQLLPVCNSEYTHAHAHPARGPGPGPRVQIAPYPPSNNPTRIHNSTRICRLPCPPPPPPHQLASSLTSPNHKLAPRWSSSATSERGLASAPHGRRTCGHR